MDYEPDEIAPFTQAELEDRARKNEISHFLDALRMFQPTRSEPPKAQPYADQILGPRNRTDFDFLRSLGIKP